MTTAQEPRQEERLWLPDYFGLNIHSLFILLSVNRYHSLVEHTDQVITSSALSLASTRKIISPIPSIKFPIPVSALRFPTQQHKSKWSTPSSSNESVLSYNLAAKANQIKWTRNSLLPSPLSSQRPSETRSMLILKSPPASLVCVPVPLVRSMRSRRTSRRPIQSWYTNVPLSFVNSKLALDSSRMQSRLPSRTQLRLSKMNSRKSFASPS
jgi:hypothetical protein